MRPTQLLPTLLLIGLLCLAIFNQCTQPVPPPNTASITGTLAPELGTEVWLSNAPASLQEAWSATPNPTDQVWPTLPGGTFKGVVNAATPGFYQLTLGQLSTEVYLAPSDSLNIEVNLQGINYTGTNANLNSYLNTLAELLDAHGNFIDRQARQLFAQPLAQFTPVLDSLQQAAQANYQAFAQQQSTLPAAYSSRCQNTIKAYHNFFKLLYPAIYNDFTGQPAQVPANYFQAIAGNELGHTDMLTSKIYARFLDRYVQIQAAGNNKFIAYNNQPGDKVTSRYQAITTLEAPQAIKSYLYHEHFNTCKTNYSPNDWQAIAHEVISTNTDTALVRQVDLWHSKAMAKRSQPDTIEIYKTVNDLALEAHIFHPARQATEASQKEPKGAYLFFHGGGWAIGMPEWGYTNCQRYAAKGMVAITFEYRLVDVHGTPIINCIADVRTAIKWVRHNAKRLGVDPNRIVMAGFSAGGHLAVTAPLATEFDAGDYPGISAMPNAMVIKSASYDLTKSSWFKGVSGTDPANISPQYLASSGMVPGLYLHSENDYLAPIDEFDAFVSKMAALNNNFQHHVFPGIGHFFRNEAAKARVNLLTDQFLQQQGLY